ncbi:hypothetical protein Zm00014a_027664, partial [Zea mays]
NSPAASRPAVNRPPPVPLPRPRPYRRTPRALPDLPDHSDCPRAPPVARAPRLRRALRRGGRAPPPPASRREAQAGHPIPTVHPRSGGLVLIRPNPILAVRRRSSGPGPLPPHTPRLSAVWAPPVSPPAAYRSAVWARLSARPRARCPPGPACQPARAPALPCPSRLSAAQAAARPRAPPAGSNPDRSL